MRECASVFPAHIRSACLHAAAVCLFLWAARWATAQQYPILPVPGAPTNVQTLFQDSAGRLWVGGDQLACFDGARFFHLADYGLPAGRTYALAEDAGGAIWIGGENGLHRFQNGQTEAVAGGVFISVAPAAPDVMVAAMGPAGKGIPAAASVVRISRSGRQWKVEKMMDLDGPGAVTADHSGRFLSLYARGWRDFSREDVSRWRPGTTLPQSDHQAAYYDPTLPGTGPMKILRDHDGCVWVGTDGEVVYTCANNQWVTVPLPNLRAAFSEAPDGDMILTGYNILAVGRPGHFQVVRPANGLPEVTTAIEARDGTIWIGSAQGLYRFSSPFRMEYWTARDGVNNPWAIRRIGGQMYAALDHTVAVLDKERRLWQTLAPFPSNIGQVMNLMPLPDGNVLVAVNPGGAVIARRDGTVIARSLPTPGLYGLRLAATAQGEIWMGGIGLVQMKLGSSPFSFTNHYLLTQPAGNVLDVQYEPHNNRLWACYNGGLTFRDSGGKWRELTTKDGLLVDACWSLAALPDGDVWYGYYNTPAFARLHPLSDGRYEVRQYREGPGIRDAESVNFDVDGRGWLWRGGNKGLSVADEANAEAGRWLLLNQSDGLSGEGVNSGSYFADTDGSIWAGIDLSIFHYSPPADLVSPQFAPQIFVSAYSWNGGAPRMADSAGDLPHGANLMAHIGTLQFERRNALTLRYRVLPGESSWHESANLDLALGTPSSGTHTLEVEARLMSGPWSPVLRRPLTILVPRWRTVQWLLFEGMTAALAAIAFHGWRRRRAVEESNLLPDLAGLRARALVPEVSEISGTVLDGRFEVGELLARGGFANVMQGFDRQQRKRCAVKIFRSEVGDADWLHQRFGQEVAALQQVRHPNVVSIYAHGSTSSGAPYLVMEFLEGRNLRAVLEAGPMAPWRAARLLRQIGSALDAIHALGICHRDVKPENIVTCREGTPEEQSMLIDFSIAIVKDANETLHGLSRAAGTFEYMAPEQAIGYAETSTDIYSLAKVAIEVLTGRRLFQLLPDASLDLASRTRELLRTLPVKLSDEAIDMLAGALEFDPARRPHVAGCFVSPVARDLESDASRTVA